MLGEHGHSLIYAPRVFSFEDSMTIATFLSFAGNLLLAVMLLLYVRANKERQRNTFVLAGVGMNIAWESFFFIQSCLTGDLHWYLLFWLLFDSILFMQALKFGTQQLTWPSNIKQFYPKFFTGFAALMFYLLAAYHHCFPLDSMLLTAWMINLVTSLSFVSYYFNFPTRELNPFLPSVVRILGTACIAAANLITVKAWVGPLGWAVLVSFAVVAADVFYLCLVTLGVFQRGTPSEKSVA